MATNKGLKCTWTNCLIWSAVMLIVGVGVRLILWFTLIFGAKIGEDYLYVEEMAESLFLYLTPVTGVLAVIFYIINYSGYMRIASRNPNSLRDVANGRFGRPWVLSLVLFIIIGFIWTGASITMIHMLYDLTVIIIDKELGDVLSYLPMYRMIGIAAGTFVLDIILFAIGARFFKPDLVQRNQI